VRRFIKDFVQYESPLQHENDLSTSPIHNNFKGVLYLCSHVVPKTLLKLEPSI